MLTILLIVLVLLLLLGGGFGYSRRGRYEPGRSARQLATSSAARGRCAGIRSA